MASQEIPCPECNQSTPVGQPACVHCGASLLVNVVLEGPVREAKERFQLAKVLLGLPPGGRDFAEVQRSLVAPRPVLAREVTWVLGQRFIEEAAAVGVVAHSERAGLFAAASHAAPEGPRPTSWKRALGVVLGLLIVVTAYSASRVLLAGRGRNPADEARPTSGPSTETVQRAIRSTVAVRCKESRAAGFFISETQVLTNAHAVCPEAEMMQVVLHDGRKLLGRTRKRDERLDLALVEVSGGEGVPLRVADASVLQSGDPVAAIGSPQGLEFTVSRGTVSYVGRNIVGVGFLQIDINVNPGNSGGPVVDGNGRVVGVLSMMMKDSNGLGLALPINYAFDGPTAMLPLPEGLDLTRWQAMVARLQESDQQDAVAAGETLGKIGLVGALLKPNGGLVAVLMVRSQQQPSPSPVQLELDNGEAGKCEGAGFPVKWSPLKGATDHRLPDKRLGAWLKKHALNNNLWVGVQEATLGCGRNAVPSHSVLRLVAGHEALEKAVVRAATAELLVVETASAKPPSSPQEAAKQSEVARLNAEVADAGRVLEACADRAKNLGSTSHEMCRSPIERLNEARTRLNRAQGELRAVSGGH
ncbi:MAG: trypsin-like peptidase domain-containing protein [Myxococcota bacterium]|nr:trypsin-like peptidase domain-containing protein [Myxococcota bacterium]